MIELSTSPELSNLQTTRSKLEDESRRLTEERKSLEERMRLLEENIRIEELKKDNKAANDSISDLKSKIDNLEKRFSELSQPGENAVPHAESPMPSEVVPEEPKDLSSDQTETATVPETETEPEEEHEVEAIAVTELGEPVVEQEVSTQKKREEKKKRRLF